MSDTIPTVSDPDTQDPDTVQLDPYRLPRHTSPRRYELNLEPDLTAGTFRVSVSIDVDTTEATPELVLNAVELEIDRCELDGVAAPYELDDSTERLFIRPTAGVEPGHHVLRLEIRGVLNDKLRGFYRSTYVDADGNEEVIATTQMQSTDCRRVFPCWDEPDFKAVFAVTLLIEPGLMAVSNGSITSETPRDGKNEVRFADTMVMSSYLVAFVVGPLEATEWHDADGIPVRLIHVPGKGNLTEFGLDVATFSLRWFQNYYGIPYPSDKVDLLALPDFAAGAMENLGCITFRENLLLVHPTNATQAERQVVADVVAHELAHMWFGDLVTMSWWNGIWLNEAFATFMEIAAVDAFRPEWERWTSFGLERSVAFDVDALSATRSVEFEVRSPADCEGMFDVLTYQKGGALLRMLEQYLGVERFREGVSQYLKAHAYGNTETEDLWDAIEQSSGEPVRRIMDSWIWQPGFPLVSAKADGNELVLTQRRFAFDPEASSTSRWAIPVAVRQGDVTESLLLDGDEARLPLGDGPVVVNAGGHGFFRVSYSDQLRARLSPDAVAAMTTLERYNLVDDASSAVTAQELDAIEFVELVERFGSEREYGVWQAIAIGLRSVRRLVVDNPEALAALEQRVVALAAPVLSDLGDPVEGEPELTAKVRGLLLGLVAVTGGDADAQATARRYYESWTADPSSVDADLAAAATAVVAATGDADDYERMFAQYRTGATPQVQLRHLHSLAEFDDAELMERTLALVMTDEVKTQNAPFVLRACIANLHHGRAAWDFVRRNWSEINDRFPRNTISRMIDTVKLHDRPTDLVQAQAFFSEHPIEQAAKQLEQILERQQVNADVRAHNESALAKSLI